MPRVVANGTLVAPCLAVSRTQCSSDLARLAQGPYLTSRFVSEFIEFHLRVPFSAFTRPAILGLLHFILSITHLP
ncbi:hypothetical protein BD410DRAFT_784668 [Rickenella mellea]|uniref:Uncharacterized protein n=1 Tax=Rickenella mellea TaxID=50990 RepID=A0A4Y7QEW8_9AGAM|nr:hypothetical protein BD410DRAFT_784668 [Rickenella mellea]